MTQASPTSIAITGESYKGGMMYWGIIGIVVAMFLVVTVRYWLGTMKIIDENTNVAVEVKRAQAVTP